MNELSDATTALRSELDELRAELRDMRDDLDHHLMSCPGSLTATSDGMMS